MGIEYHLIYNDDKTHERKATGYEVLINDEFFETCDFSELHETIKRAKLQLHN